MKFAFSAAAGTLGLGLAAFAQQLPLQAEPTLQVMTAPATPTDITGASLSPVPQGNATQYPLPGAPQNPIGTTQLNFNIAQGDAPNYPGIPIKGNYLGVSIELSVLDEIVGKTGAKLHVPFLNYMASLQARAGMGPILRIGGNTQDTAIYNDTSTTTTNMIVKVSDHGFGANGAPITPSIEYNDLVFQAMQALVEKIDARFIFGLNMVNYTASFTPAMVTTLQRYVGDQIELILAGNEPDRYSFTGNRGPDYDIPAYLNEWDSLTGGVMNQLTNVKKFTAPNVCCNWSTKQITVDNGMQTRFADRLGAISAIKYPQSLCGAVPIGHEFYLNHTTTINTLGIYDQDAIEAAVAAGLPYYLVETNTASCIGIAGVSNAFTSALWGIDAALQLAYRNHSGMFWHTSGINTIYNLFTAPAYNASNKAWKTGPIFYSSLVVAEALASVTGQLARVMDLNAGQDSIAAYGIFEGNDTPLPQKAVLINMINDQSGANTWTAQLPVDQGVTQVSYKILQAPNVGSVDNITWANQTFGYWSDGTLRNVEQIQIAQCNNTLCSIPVPAPGAALVFLTPSATAKSAVSATTFIPYGTDNPTVVVNSNGSRGNRVGATSKGSASGALPALRLPTDSAFWTRIVACVTLGAAIMAYMP